MSKLLVVRPTVWVGAISLCLNASIAIAQGSNAESLEQTYARLCGTGQKNEACTALRAALMAKLSGASETPGATTPPSTVSAPMPGATASISPQWGFWAQLAGTTWLSDRGNLHTYAWQKRGEVLSEQRLVGANDPELTTFTLSPDGASLKRQIGTQTYSFQPQADGSFTQTGGDRRFKWTLSGDVMTATNERLVDGHWSPVEAPPQTRRRLAANDVERHQAGLAQRRQEVDAMIAREWGVLPQLIGQKFVSESAAETFATFPHLVVVTSFSWLDRGSEAAISEHWLATGAPAGWTKLTRDSATGKFRAEIHYGRRADVSMTADGRVHLTWDHAPGSNTTATGISEYHLAGGMLHYDSYVLTNGKKGSVTASRMTNVTGHSYESLRTALVQQKSAAAVAAANSKKGRGGLLRAAIGAGLGVAAGNASGMDATQTLGAAAKGVALMTPDSKVGQVIGASGDAVLQSSGLGTAATGGGTGSAGFTRKTNLAVGNSCPGFTMQNYRTEALIKDANVQLRTMCGQAFEYYNMYENAIRQGYSEADANRTYAAHEGATRNLKAFTAGSQ